MGGTALIAATTTSCIPLLLRLALGRAMMSAARLAIRGALSGGSKRKKTESGLLTIGRSLAICEALQRVGDTRLREISIERKGERVALGQIEQGKTKLLTPSGDLLQTLTAHNRANNLHHDNFGNYMGRSQLVLNGEIHHYNLNDRFVGSDRLHHRSKKVLHFDRRKRKIGETKISNIKGGLFTETSRGSVDYVKALTSHEVYKCPQANDELKRLRRLQSECASGKTSSCSQVSDSLVRLQQLSSQCGKN